MPPMATPKKAPKRYPSRDLNAEKEPVSGKHENRGPRWDALGPCEVQTEASAAEMLD